MFNFGADGLNFKSMSPKVKQYLNMILFCRGLWVSLSSHQSSLHSAWVTLKILTKRLWCAIAVFAYSRICLIH